MAMEKRVLFHLLLLWLACLSSSQIQNWAGNIEFDEALFVEPETVEEVVSIVKENDRVAIAGTRHSFSNLSQTTEGALLSTKKLNKILSCCDNMMVTVQPGVTYAQLGAYLYQRDYAVPNYASLPHLSVGGAISTATHGSGAGLGNLATSVSSLKLVVANGELVHLKRGDPLFNHAVVALGAGGVIVEISLDVVPAFDVQQCIYTDVSFKSLKADLEKILEDTYSVSLFTQWRQSGLISSLWAKHKVSKGAMLNISSQTAFECPLVAGRLASDTSVHPLPTMESAEACSPPGVGPSYIQLPHFLPTHTPSHGDELQTEFFVKREHMWDVLDDIFNFEQRNNSLEDVLFVSEIRFIAADSLTLSPQRVLGDVVAIHFTWKPKIGKVWQMLSQIEDLLRPYSHMPHWGKIFNPQHYDLEKQYGEGLKSFRQDFLDRYDPMRKFTTEFVRVALCSECLAAATTGSSEHEEL